MWDSWFLNFFSHAVLFLHIRLQPEDQGAYQCQAPTLSGVRSVLYWLTVKKPSLTVTGETVVSLGDRLELNCVLRDSLTNPPYISWHHNDTLLNRKDSNNNLNLISSTVLANPARTLSKLIIKETRLNHAGNYSCSTTSLNSVPLPIFILKGMSVHSFILILFFILAICLQFQIQ